MFFARAGEYEPCGIFSLGHFILIAITTICIAIALKNTIHKTKDEITKIIKMCTIIIWVFEFLVISFKLYYGDYKDINTYVPLYYCSLLLYAGFLSSFTKGKLKRAGDVFLATGGIIGGLVFIIFPTTSLLTYPVVHFISLHSFLFHGMMVYLGLLINITDYIKIEKKDIIYYASLVGIICLLAYIINKFYGSNLMFISEKFVGMPIEIIYDLTGKYYTFFMCIAQMTLPFILTYFGRKVLKVDKMKEA